MFTGLIQGIGTIESIPKTHSGKRLRIKNPWGMQLEIGESIAIQGVCLTVTKRTKNDFQVEIVPETLQKTTLKALKTGQKVNLERALQMGDRLGGHWVQGHVDSVGKIEAIMKNRSGCRLRIKPPKKIGKYIAQKGSITIDGVSLTVSKKTPTHFEVALIPQTLKSTTLANLKKGDKVNLEVDLIAHYLEALLKK